MKTVRSESKVVMIDLERLKIDHSYQRSEYINKSMVRAIRIGYDPMLAGVITVGRRQDGSMWVVDGQHRVLGAKDAGIEKIACVIFDSRGPSHEAEVFFDLNTRRTGVNCISMYKALLAQGEEATVVIQSLLEEHGFCIGKNMGQFAAANAIRQSYQAGVLGRVLNVISHSFGGGADRWKWMFGSANFVQMLTIIYEKFGDLVDDTRMITVLKRTHHDEYQRMARANAGTTGHRAKNMVKPFIDGFYNCQLKKNRIEIL